MTTTSTPIPTGTSRAGTPTAPGTATRNAPTTIGQPSAPPRTTCAGPEPSRPTDSAGPVAGPILDVVIPVHNEQRVLERSVRRAHAHLTRTFPYPFRITIADNASTDLTWQIAQDLAGQLPHLRAVRLEQKGRGRALAQVWAGSDATVLAYMDVDLSTDLDALGPLVAPLLSGHSAMAIGSRLAQGARVVRGPRREAISRCYNLLLHLVLGVRFSDAQCGFKAIRADVAQALLPLVQDRTWFFDTELLVLAERAGLRIHEVPVDWDDDPDSRVDIASTALDDLRGIWRLRRGLWTGAIPVEAVTRRLGQVTRRTDGLSGQMARFAAVGAVSTVVHLGLFALIAGAGVLGAQAANAVALLAATVANTAANRWWTFGVRGRVDAVRHHLQSLAVLGLTFVTTAAGLALLHAAAPGAGTVTKTLTLAAANLVATAIRFVAMRHWIFRAR